MLKLLRPAFIISLLLLTAVAAFGLTEENANQQFDVSAGGKIVVDVEFGTVDVVAGPDGKVSVEAYRKIESKNEAREKEYFAAAPIVISKDGNTVTVRSRRQVKDKKWEWNGSSRTDARYTVKVPKNFNADLRTNGGAISATDITGEVKANTSGGELKFTRLQGPLDGKSNGGGIELKACEGDLKVDTNGGGIDASGGKGKLDARTSGGNVAVRDFVGDANVKTSGGKLTLEKVTGKLTGRTSGGSISAILVTPVAGDVSLETSAGSIDVLVPADAGLDVDAETSIGSVSTDLPIVTTHKGREELKGSVNGGGTSLFLRTSAGSIAIKAGSTLALR